MIAGKAARNMSQLLVRYLLRFDGLAGLAAGFNTLLTSTWLASLYGLPTSILIWNGLANLVYGTFSSTVSNTAETSARISQCAQRRQLYLGTGLLRVRFQSAQHRNGLCRGACCAGGPICSSLGIIEWRYRHQLLEKPRESI